MLQIMTPLQETQAYKSIFAKGKIEGKLEGKLEGEAYGIAKGKVEGEAFALKRLIMRRFGKLSTRAEQRIDKANLQQLETWMERIFDATDVQQLLE